SFTSATKYYHILTLVFMGVVPTAIAFTLWFEIIRRIPVQKASVFQFLIPIIATLFALAMKEYPDWFFALGGVLIIGGLYITQKS
ncbi:MAG: EamA family transporter, partial [Candidatus Heimdallarchaeota archaeon]|nr:EamA family transporter [Candidatus Heimdallarchaeota archaeon]